MSERGFCVWFTGLPGVGKTTLARLLAAELRGEGRRVEVVDGNAVRQRLTRGLGFSREDSDEKIRRIAFVAHLLARNGVVAVTAAISPYRALRQEAREAIGAFVEVHVKCPVQVCMSRDEKGLYRGAVAAGEMPNFTRVSDPYEEPLAPEVVVETDRMTPEACVARMMTTLRKLGYVSPPGCGVTRVPLPAYQVQAIEARLDGGLDAVSRYLVELVDRALAKDDEVSALTASDSAAVEARLRSLGYLD